MKSPLYIYIFLLFLFLAPAAHARETTVSLAKLAPGKIYTFRGISGRYAMKIPIPARWKVAGAVLGLSYVNSTALLRSNSRLVVWLNGRPLAQIALDPSAPEGLARIALPGALLKAGYNGLRLTVSQHCTTGREDPGAPELWTTLELDQSFVDIDYSLKAVPLRISSIADFLFDPRISTENKINLVAQDRGAATMEASAIAAMGVSARFGRRPVSFTVSDALKPGLDNIVIGGTGFVAGITGGRYPDAGGPLIGLLPMPGDNAHALIVIQGASAGGLRKAAEAFASICLPFPAAQYMRVEDVKVPLIAPNEDRGMLVPDRKYSFGDLGLGTTTFAGTGARPGSIRVGLPAGVMLQPNKYVRLALHLAYCGGMRRDSALSIWLNGKFMSAIQLDNPGGSTLTGYRLDVPASLFKAGDNTMTFKPVLIPIARRRRGFMQAGNLELTLYGDSTLGLPPMAMWTAMPRVGLFTRYGFPFSRRPGMEDTLVYLAGRDSRTASAAMDLLSLVAQKTGVSGCDVRFTYKEPSDTGKDIIAVGPARALSGRILKAMPAGKGGKWLLRCPLPPGVVATVRGLSGPDDRDAFLAEFESPWRAGRSVVLLTSASDGSILNAAEALLRAGNRCRGGLVIFGPRGRITSLAPRHIYYTGSLGLYPRLNMLIYKHPLVFFSLLLCVLAALAFYAFKKSKALRQKR